MSTRFGGRSKDQFQSEIIERTNIESLLARVYENKLNEGQSSARYILTPSTGHRAGEFVENDKEITKGSDFELFDTETGETRLIDIKFSKNKVKQLHYKVSHLQAYIPHGVWIVTFMGLGTADGCFAVTPPEEQQRWLLEEPSVYFALWKRVCSKIAVGKMLWAEIDLRGIE